jgi:hypothetical protein
MFIYIPILSYNIYVHLIYPRYKHGIEIYHRRDRTWLYLKNIFDNKKNVTFAFINVIKYKM